MFFPLLCFGFFETMSHYVTQPGLGLFGAWITSVSHHTPWPQQSLKTKHQVQGSDLISKVVDGSSEVKIFAKESA